MGIYDLMIAHPLNASWPMHKNIRRKSILEYLLCPMKGNVLIDTMYLKDISVGWTRARQAQISHLSDIIRYEGDRLRNTKHSRMIILISL